MKTLQEQAVLEDSLESTPLPLQDSLREAGTSSTAGRERQGARNGGKRARAAAGEGVTTAPAAVQPNADGLDDVSGGGASSASLGASEHGRGVGSGGLWFLVCLGTGCGVRTADGWQSVLCAGVGVFVCCFEWKFLLCALCFFFVKVMSGIF